MVYTASQILICVQQTNLIKRSRVRDLKKIKNLQLTLQLFHSNMQQLL